MAERPTIGVTAGSTAVPIPEGRLDSHYVGRAYVRMLARVGGDALLLPAPDDDFEAVAERQLDRVDGVLLAGGIDIAPSTYGAGWAPIQEPDPNRDRLELALIGAAIARGVPLLGVCRGMEMINVALGGTLHRYVEHTDVPATDEDGFHGVRRHLLDLEPGSRVAAALGVGAVEVLCLHHQAPDRIGSGLAVTARAADGIVEAVELEDDEPFCLGVLWHPEQMVDAGDLQSRLYGALAAAARQRARTGAGS